MTSSGWSLTFGADSRPVDPLGWVIGDVSADVTSFRIELSSGAAPTRTVIQELASLFAENLEGDPGTSATWTARAQAVRAVWLPRPWMPLTANGIAMLDGTTQWQFADSTDAGPPSNAPTGVSGPALLFRARNLTIARLMQEAATA